MPRRLACSRLRLGRKHAQCLGMMNFTHLQFEALLPAARESSNSCGFALVAMPGLPGLRIFEATSADIADLDEEHSH